MRINKKQKTLTKRETMFSDPKNKSPIVMFNKIFSLKQISPFYFDKMTLLAGRGNSFSKKRSINVKLSFQVKDLYRLLEMKNLPRGSTTSREATPLGDPRGVPKQFSTFWSFSKHFPQRSTKHISKSLPICLEGFRNRLKQSSQSGIQRIEVNNSVNILVFKTRSNNIEIQLNLIMGDTENNLLGHLFDLIESTTDFEFSGDEGPDVDLNELWSSLPSEPQDNSHTVASDDFLYPEIQSTVEDSPVAGSIPQEQYVIDSFIADTNTHDTTTSLPQLQYTTTTSSPTLSPAISPTPTIIQIPAPSPTQSPTLSPTQSPTLSPTTQYTITVPHPSLPQMLIQVPGTNQLQLVTVSPDPSLTMLSPLPPDTFDSQSFTFTANTSLPPQSPSSSLSSLTSPLSTADAYVEMRRKNNEACTKYRQRRKTKQDMAEEELKALKDKNDLLNMKVRQMESIIQDLRANVITNITQPRVIKRDRDGDDDSRDQPGNKRMRWEP